MGSISAWLYGLPAPAVCAVVAALVLCEDGLFVGFVLPGESAVVVAGVLAGQGRVSVYWLALSVVLAAVVGDSVGYEIGRRLGPRLLESRRLRGRQERIERARRMIRRRGAAAVFFGRFIAFFRTLVPALCGISRMPYRRFLAFNALGGLVWGVGFTLLGYYVGAAYRRLEHAVGRDIALAAAALIVVVGAVWYWRRRRARTAAAGPDGEEGPHAPRRSLRDREGE